MKKTPTKKTTSKSEKVVKKTPKVEKVSRPVPQPFTVYQEEKSSKLFENSKEILLAAVCILVIFYVALMASMPRKEGTDQNANVQADQRTGDQKISLTILPDGQTQTSQTVSTSQQNVITQQNTQSPMAMLMNKNASSVEAGKQLVFKIDKFQKLAKQPLKFNLYDESGRELTPDYLETQNDHKVHFVLVSADFKEYQHLHPEYKNGVWNVSANMPTAGSYFAYVDVKPVNSNDLVLRKELVVRSPSVLKDVKYPGPTENLTAKAKDVSAMLAPDPSLVNHTSSVAYTLTRNGKPVDNLKPYLASFGHVVVLKQGSPEIYMHLHPGKVTDEKKAVIPFSVNLPAQGRYTAFAEFKIGSDVLTFPITFDVP